MVDALLEIGCEELPVSYIEPALEQIKTFALKSLQDKMLVFSGKPVVSATPRRLVLYLHDVEEKSAQRLQRIAGPPERMLKDDNGDYTLASVGFSKKVGIPVEELKVYEGKVCAEIKIGGEKAKKILQEVFSEIIKNIRFPKTMVWDKTGFRFARPIRNILALLGSEVVKFEIAGVKSGKSTTGLYTLSSKKVEIVSASKYFDKLKTLCIRVNQQDRKKYISTLIQNAVPSAKWSVLVDEELLYENCFLVETPSVIVGEFDRKYLSLPREVLVTCLKAKQKFFTVMDSNHNILPTFIGIRNGRSEFQTIVKEGYERVLTARLEDARFFYEQDKKVSFDTWIEKLKGVTFHELLGSLYEKKERMERINEKLMQFISVDEKQDESITLVNRASALSKVDLVSSLVFEYPELQGTAGMLYAQAKGEHESVCRAIQDHYKPAGQDDTLPRDLIGSIVALSDKIDSLTGYFVAGIVPSGNKDPFGLRRIALGVIRIIIDRGFHINLESIIFSTMTLFPRNLQEQRSELLHLILDFFRQRLEIVFASSGFKHDEVNAVLESTWNDEHNIKDINDVLNRLKALAAIRSQPDFEALSAGYKRADNICRQAGAKKIDVSITIQPELFKSLEEQKLHVKYGEIKDTLESLQMNKKEVLSQTQYEDLLNRMISLRKPLDTFFETVMVMVEDKAVCANRLSLLSSIVNLYHKIADFSQIVTK